MVVVVVVTVAVVVAVVVLTLSQQTAPILRPHFAQILTGSVT